MKAIKCFILILCVSGCATTMGSQAPPAALQTLSSAISQAIIVEPQKCSQARITTWERGESGWQPVFWSMRAMVGRRGIAPKDEKREGDGRTPSGIYPLYTAFGYASLIRTGLAYRQATKNDFWIDDAASPQYNQWVTGKPQAKSYEEMRRKDDLYKYGAVIEYNTSPVVPGRGSAIFMHIWRGPGRSTSGCVALSPRSLKSVLSWLDARRQPVIILEEPRIKN